MFTGRICSSRAQTPNCIGPLSPLYGGTHRLVHRPEPHSLGRDPRLGFRSGRTCVCSCLLPSAGAGSWELAGQQGAVDWPVSSIGGTPDVPLAESRRPELATAGHSPQPTGRRKTRRQIKRYHSSREGVLIGTIERLVWREFPAARVRVQTWRALVVAGPRA